MWLSRAGPAIRSGSRRACPVIIQGVEHDIGRTEFPRTLLSWGAGLYWRNSHWDVLSLVVAAEKGPRQWRWKQARWRSDFSTVMSASAPMSSNPFLVESDTGVSRYTHLFACISEEDGGYSVQVRLSNSTKPENTAWGEEIADSFETASMLIAALAAEFSIEQERIKIEIRLEKITQSTLH
jgi:hypothetical protein